MLRNAQATGAASNTALGGQKDALARGEAFLGSSNNSNPLQFLYNMETPSGSTASQAEISDIFEPGITSIDTQQKNNVANLAGINDVANTEISAYGAMKPNWTLAPQPNANGQWYYYNTNVAPGQPPQEFAAGEIPPGVGGSPGGSPGSADHTSTLAGSHNPYGIKMTGSTTDMFSGLGATAGPAATDGGNFWTFPDDSTGEKAARTLLTSSLYASDSVDQALRQWSNYTGTGKYPGYNADILKGTGIDPNSTIKSLSSNQIDTVLQAMKKAESVGAISSGQPGNLMDQAAAQVAGGTIGFDDAFGSLNNMFGGKLTKTQFITAVQKLKPDFNVNQSNGQASSQGTNTSSAAELQPLVDATNGIINGQPSASGGASVPSITQLYDNLPWQAQTSSEAQYTAAKALGSTLGDLGGGQTAIQQWEGAVSELRAKAESVLLQAANLGISVGGDTAQTLFPNNISKDGLTQSIARVQGYEKQMIDSLKVGGTATTGGGSNNPLGI